MVSRVAAVKAPRTHNRRRVTGSRGRRNEGGESEPQRPNMSRCVFNFAVLLLLVVMMCCGSGAAAADEKQSVADPNFEWKGIPKDVTVESLGAPGLLKVGSDVFAVAEAQCKKSGENNVFTGIASQIITTQTANTPVEVLKDSKDKTQFLEDGSEDPRKKVDVSRPTTVMKRNDIYMLVGKYSRTAAGEKSGANDGGLLLVKGEVIDESGGGKRIKWKDNDDVSRASVGKLEPWTGMTGGGGSGVKMEDGTLLFPVEGTKKKGEAQNDEKAVSLIIHSLKDTKSWKLSNWMSDGGCGDPSVVEWKDKLMMMTACDDGRRKVYEIGDKGDSWTEALGTLSRVWGNKKGVRSGFITATIDGVEDNRNVMLVTLPVYANKADKEVNVKGRLHLWLTDNTHIVDIGPVSGGAVAASSLLYKSSKSGNEKEELIALYEKKDEGDTPSLGMVSVILTEQLERLKDVLTTWKKVDERVSQLCATLLAQKDPSADTACTDKITDGLVGFLSGSFSGNTWRDEYLAVDATVKNGAAKAAKTSDGVTFRGAWAEWPVGEQGENQLYHFANYNFTLVATVSIDKVPEEGDTPIPVMGVKRMKGDKSTVLLGLSYNNREKKLELLSSGGKASELSSNWERGKTHQVAIVLRKGNQGFVYVDGRRVEGAPLDLKDKGSKGISHFYIGGDGDSAGSREGVSVTVTNVLLYNRPLSDIELTVLNTIKLSIPQTAEEGETDEGTALDGGAHGDAGSMRGSRLLPSLLLLLLGLWWFASL
ncbi:putative trans-sialidase, Group V [Trypanosoma cruzi]|uniref:Trans-sialidase, putative n=2 Tax=Trypanosoma cruzi TaxID=5693 RepID=Q4DT30_TRYCC|nr:trans-sialidase, putative [Trypanosoma cruzi]EAN95686.1 trans-sialidase, putative [Trypanosoma cruzi]PWV03498.1 putative trans-sialidase, Group V [Trypanosoma cruzi]|eukprot:XP_817537.1 trans-sialidase [Trypanosoma cruzi strain CL Brener]